MGDCETDLRYFNVYVNWRISIAISREFLAQNQQEAAKSAIKMSIAVREYFRKSLEHAPPETQIHRMLIYNNKRKSTVRMHVNVKAFIC